MATWTFMLAENEKSRFEKGTVEEEIRVRDVNWISNLAM